MIGNMKNFLIFLFFLPSFAFGQIFRSDTKGPTFPDATSNGTIETKNLVSSTIIQGPNFWSNPNGVYFGSSGSGMSESFECTTTLDTGPIAAMTTATQNIACPGVRLQAACVVGSPYSLEAGLMQSCLISGLDTIALRTANVTAADVTPTVGQIVSIRAINKAYTTLMPDLPATVSHVIFNGTALVDTVGGSWTMNGTVPQLPRSGNVPPGAGPFGSSIWYRLGTGSDALDFAGDFTGVIVYRIGSNSNQQVLVDTANAGGSVSGFKVLTQGTSISFYTHDTSSVITTMPWLPPGDGSVAVIGFGRQGTTHQFLSGSGLVIDSGTSKAAVDTSHGSFLGVNGASGATPLLGNLIEVWFSSEAPTASKLSNMTREVYRKLGSRIVSMFGDSNTENYADRMPSVTVVPAHFTNDGVSGDTTTLALARWPAIAAKRPTHIVIMLGTNDRTLSAATAIQNLKIIYEDATSRGIKLVLLTVPPFYGVAGWNQAQETIRTTINAAIMSYQGKSGITVINTDILGNGATPPALQTQYDSGDHLHFSEAGQIYLATLVGDTL